MKKNTIGFHMKENTIFFVRQILVKKDLRAVKVLRSRKVEAPGNLKMII